MGTPNGPSNAKIKSDAMVEEARVRFEADRRHFLERVASYDIASEGQRRMDGGSLEYIDPSFKDPNDFGIAGLSIPGKFDPSLDFSKFSTQHKPDLSWATAPNLGYTPDWAQSLSNPLSFYYGAPSSNYDRPSTRTPDYQGEFPTNPYALRQPRGRHG